MTFGGEIPNEVMELPFRLVSFRRNEIEGRISIADVKQWMKGKKRTEPFLVDSAGKEGVQGQNRTQRNSLVLHHVAYLIEASVRLTAKANQPRTQPDDGEDHGPDTVAKYVSMFQRRVANGQCFHRPYLGIREFAASFGPPVSGEQPLAWGTRDNPESLGFMLHDLRFDQNEGNRPGFFDARVAAGVMHCDTEAPGPNGESPVTVYW
jgi:CRISPR-associated protein Cas5d